MGNENSSLDPEVNTHVEDDGGGDGETANPEPFHDHGIDQQSQNNVSNLSQSFISLSTSQEQSLDEHSLSSLSHPQRGAKIKAFLKGRNNQTNSGLSLSPSSSTTTSFPPVRVSPNSRGDRKEVAGGGGAVIGQYFSFLL